MKVLLINGAAKFGHSGGCLNSTLHNVACKTLSDLSHPIQETHIEEGYVVEDEVEKIVWADVIIYQMAGWWMGTPWLVKKYIDEVFTAGQGRIYDNDGRTRQDPTKQYGTGGLLQGRRYLLSVTWNAPKEAFDEFDDFFDGRGVDGVYLPFHKSQQFVGLKALPTFMVNDVIKEPQVDKYLADYKAHLETVFGRL